MTASTPASSTPTLRIADGGPNVDAVARNRLEYKFVFRGGDVASLRSVLSQNARPISFGTGQVSRVNSIYFDDPALSAAQESVDGVARRVKARLRWYDTGLEARQLHFELKRRRGFAVSKLRSSLLASAPLGEFSYSSLCDQLGELLDTESGSWLGLRADPTALVSYKREHFRDPESGLRLTLDYEIEGYDQSGLRAPQRRFAVPVSGLVVVEVKTPESGREAVRRVLYPLKPRLARCSKYVHCCLRMGWEPHPEIVD